VVDFLATERHFADHLRPVWEALPADHRGAFMTTRAALTISDRPTVVASFGDLNAARGHARPIILMEHGAGQTYRGQDGRLLGHTSYAGGRNRAGVILYVLPGPAAASAYREAGSRVPQVQVGVPKMDPWHRGDRTPNLTDPPTVAVSFHWDCMVAPETRSAWARYLPAFLDLHRQGWRILGHAHPRIAGTLAPRYEAAGIEFVPDFDSVLQRASVYACDNSSTMYEFASTGRPVVVLNHRIYRRDVHHGLRFWAGSRLGPHVDQPEDVRAGVRQAHRNTNAARQARAAAVAMAYAHVDGHAADRAAQAIVAAVGA
jgi:hypothetical protein